jgi:hypothetical protein
VLSANAYYGVFLVGTGASSNAIQGNFIGVNASGSAALGNLRSGVVVSGAPANLIGGTVSGFGNVISGNSDAGIYLYQSGAQFNLIAGNQIGTDATGTIAIGNLPEGIFVLNARSNTIGGANEAARNLISGNATRGIFLTNSVGHVIQGNFIGVQADGSSPLPNLAQGVEFESGSHNNTLGGSSEARNVIAYSPALYAGVRVRDASTNNAIRCNSIFGNGSLGIDLGGTGVTSNDPCDSDAGGNNLQNFPVLTEAVSGAGTVVSGSLNSSPGSSFTLQFYASPDCDPSGHAQGKWFLGEKSPARQSWLRLCCR